MIIKEGNIDQVIPLLGDLEEFIQKDNRATITERIQNRDSLILIAYLEDQAAGFKLGYAKSKKHFYSWLGGVLPQFRQKGIARRLLDYQEKWARNNGYTVITVKSRNRFKNMIRLLVKNNYLITGVEVSDAGILDKKILFEKRL